MDKKNSREDEGEKEKLGVYLRRARKAEKLDLLQLGRETRISLEFLRSIENGEYGRLPGEPYVRAYLRSLSSRFGLDEEKILDWYREETHQKSQKNTDLLDFSGNPRESRSSSRTLILVLVALFLGFLFVLNHLRGQMEVSPQTTPSSSSHLQLPADEDSLPELDHLAAPAPFPEDSGKDSSKVLPLSSSSSSTPKSSSSQTKKKAFTRLSISCPADTNWVSVESHSKELWARVIRSENKTYVRTFQDTITLKMGNPENLLLLLNGQKIETLTYSMIIYDGKVLH